MPIFIGLLAALQIVFALLIISSAASAIHETLAAVLFGSGVIALALSSILLRVDKLLDRTPESAQQPK